MNKHFYSLLLITSVFASCTCDKGELAVLPIPVPNTPPVMVTITITDFAFTPTTAAATVGDTIKWINNGPSPHTADSGVIPSGAAVIASGNLNVTNTYTYIVTEQGTYNYICSYHPMVGTINVSQ